MDSFLDSFIGIVSIVITLYIAKNELSVGHKREIATQQLQNVYLPLFKILEPYLYKTPSQEVIEEFFTTYDSIVSSHYELIDPNLINDVKILRENLDDTKFYKIYESVCSCVERNFEKNRKTLLLPTRSVSYKLNNDQYPKETRELISQFAISVMKFLLTSCALLIIALAADFLIDIFKRIFSKT